MRIFISILFLLGVVSAPSLALATTCADAAKTKHGDALESAQCAAQCVTIPNQTLEEVVGAPFVIDDCGTQFCCAKLKGGASSADATLAYDKTYGYESPLGDVSIPNLIGRVITQILPLIGSLFLVLFLWGGFLWLTSNGDETRVKKARGTLTNAVIGMAIIIGAYTIVAFLLDTLGSAALG
jgi:hypothetical protein